MRHVAAPAICAAHQLRIISSERSERMHILKHLEIAPPGKFESVKDVDAFVEDLRQATYHAILSSFVQGLGIISKASSDQKWNVNLSECIRIWRAGCISAFIVPIASLSPSDADLSPARSVKSGELASTDNSFASVVCVLTFFAILAQRRRHRRLSPASSGSISSHHQPPPPPRGCQGASKDLRSPQESVRPHRRVRRDCAGPQRIARVHQGRRSEAPSNIVRGARARLLWAPQLRYRGRGQAWA